MADSMPKDAGGLPGARKARAEPALTATAGLFHARVGNLVKVGHGNIRAAAAAAGIAAGADAGGAVIFRLKRVQRAVGQRAHFDFLKTGGPVADGERLVKPGEHQAHRRLCLAGEFRGQHAFDARAEFRAEAAAHVFGDDAHLALVQLQRASQTVAHAGNALRRSPGRDAVIRP